MLRLFKYLYRFITCKKNEVRYEEVEPSKDITPSEPVKIPVVKSYDYNYNYGTRYYN